MRESALCVDAFVEWVEETLASGKNIEIRGFGAFETRSVSEKNYPTAFSPKFVPAHRKVIFRPCEKLKQAVWEQKA